MAKRKNRAATDVELGLIADIQPDATMTDHHTQHSNANKAIIDLYEALDIDIDGNTGDIILGADFGNNVPDSTTADAGKVLATDGSDYGWVFVDSGNIKLTNAPGAAPFGISDDPAYDDAETQKDANALFVRYISENEEAVKELAAVLGLELEVDVDGNITIEIGTPDPGNPPLVDISGKFDVGTGTTNLNDATTMEAAIEKNEENLGDLVVNIGGSVDVDGNITLPNGGAPIDISAKLDKGTGLVASDAKELEDAIGANKTDIDSIVVELGGTVNPDGSIDVDNIDGLPDGGTNGDFLTINASGDAAWVDADVFPKGASSYADAKAVEDAIAAITGLEVLAFQGNVADDASLPNGADEGHVYLVESTSEFTVMTSDGWKFLSKLGISSAELSQLQTDINSKFDKGATTYTDAKAMEDAIKAIVVPDVSGFATQDDLDQEKIDRAAGDATTLTAANDYTDSAVSNINVDTSDLATKTELAAEEAARVKGDADTLTASNTYTDQEVAKVIVPDVSDLTTKTYVDTADATKFDKGATTYADAKAMEDAIGTNKTNIDSIVSGLGGDINNIEVDALPDQTGASGKFLTTDGADASWADVPEYDDQGVKGDIAQNVTNIAQNTTDIATKFDKDVNGGTGPTTYTNAKVMEDAITGNASSIGSLDAKIDGVIDQLTGGDATIDLDITSKLDRGNTNYDDAEAIEEAIVALDTGKSDVNHDHDATYATKADYATKAELTTEKDARIAGDDALQNQIDDIQSSGYDETQLRADFAAADAATLTAANVYTDEEISKIPPPTPPYDDTQVKSDIQANKDSIEALGEKGYDDTGVKADIEANAVAIEENKAAIQEIDIPDVSNLATKTEVSDGDTATLTTANSYTDAEIAKIPATDVSDLATKDELTAGLADKSDEPHTHDDLAAGNHNHDSDYSAADHTHPPQDLTHNHDAEYQPVGDYATNSDLTTGLDGKSDTTHSHDAEYAGKTEFDAHTHDTTHNHDSEYATKTELKAVDDKADANTSKNTEQDGKIAALESANTSLDNKVEALENALISAKYKVEVASVQAPREGFVRLDNADPTNIALMVFNAKDANGVTHDFSGVKTGDKLTIATSSAVGTYNITSSTTGSISVESISGNGTFADDDVVDVKVSPEFDASSYATTTYVDAQDATKFNKGATGPTTYTTAELMETAINANKTAINDNADLIDTKFDKGSRKDNDGNSLPLPYADVFEVADAIEQNAEDIAAIDLTTDKVKLAKDRQNPFYEHTDVNGDAVDMETQAEVNEYIAEQAFFKGMTWGELAGRTTP